MPDLRRSLMRALWFACVTITLASAPLPVAAQSSDACAVLSQHPGWSDDLKAAQEKWRVTPGTLMVIIDQESRFNPVARGAGAGGANPERNFGFAQANLRTWNWFLRETGRTSGSRSDFGLSVDFVGWHFATMERRIGAARTNVVEHYLAYKMGEGGYRRGAPASARALASRLAARARTFDSQLAGCGF
jgi:hypothetical protein